jgi:hypothetical protein
MSEVNKKNKEKTKKITVILSSKQYEFIKKNKIDPSKLLKKAIKLKKQKKLQETHQLRTKNFYYEFEKIKSRIESYTKGKKKNDSLWSMRYNHAKTLTRSYFIRYGGPKGDKLYDLFVKNYNLLLKESKK